MKSYNKKKILDIFKEYENTNELEEFIKRVLNNPNKIFRSLGKTFIEINCTEYIGAEDKIKLADEFIKENDIFANLKKICNLMDIKLNLEISDIKLEKNKINKALWYEECNYRFTLPLRVYVDIVDIIYELQERKRQEKKLKYTN